MPPRTNVRKNLDALFAAIELKQSVVDQLMAIMAEQNVTTYQLAKRIKGCRQNIDNILDPNDTTTSLHTLLRVANALGYTMSVVVDSENKHLIVKVIEEKKDATEGLHPDGSERQDPCSDAGSSEG